MATRRKAAPDPKTDLITYRIRLGITLREMSHKTGLSPATLHRLERGLIKPSARSLVCLQDGLRLRAAEVEYLLAQSASRKRHRKHESW